MQHAATGPLNIGIFSNTSRRAADPAQAARGRKGNSQLVALEAARIATRCMPWSTRLRDGERPDRECQGHSSDIEACSRRIPRRTSARPRASRPGTMDGRASRSFTASNLSPRPAHSPFAGTLASPSTQRTPCMLSSRRVPAADGNIEVSEFVGITGDKHFTDTPPTPPLLSGTAAID